MNRNVLKIVAVISMIIDHVGYFLLDNNIIFRIIGRIAFPIFAFFIAEGMKYTRSRKKYVLLLAIFAIFSQIPYALLGKFYQFNILFTLLIAIGIITLIEQYQKTPNRGNFGNKLFMLLFIFITILTTTILGAFEIIDYGILGVLLISVFYFIPHPKRLLIGGILLLLMTIRGLILAGFTWLGTIQIWALLSILLLLLYNLNKGKLNLKYLFYIAYPAHLFIIWIITKIL